VRELATNVIRTLREHGFQAWLVGGCVRDIHLNVEPKDYDVATDATPAQINAIFPDSDLVGAHFGVVIVRGETGYIEVATFRKDHGYSDGRRPDEVSFVTNPQDDAARRDFTIGAMFMDPETNETLDFFGGLNDLHNGVIRTVGDPNVRFAEDYIRMLRAIRFAVRFKFSIDPMTMVAISSNAHKITNMAAERIHGELVPILSHRNADYGVALLIQSGLLQHILPEADQPATHYRFQQVGEFSFPLSMAILLTHCDQRIIESVMRRIVCTTKETEETVWLVANRNSLMTACTMPVHELKRLLRHQYARHLTAFYRTVKVIEPLTAICNGLSYIARQEWTHEDLWPTPLINGETLKGLGMTPGPQFKVVLEAVENAQLDGEITTVDEALDLVASLHINV